MNQGVLSEGGRAVICTPFCCSFVDQHRVDRRVGREGAAVRIGAADLVAGDHDVGDAARSRPR